MLNKTKSLLFSFLKKSEKYTKTDMVYLAKGGSWLTLGQITTSLLTLTLTIAFANLISQDAYGMYKYILSIAGILGALTLTGMNVAVTQDVAKGNEGALKSSTAFQLKWNVIMALTATAGAVYYFVNQNNLLGFGLLIIGGFYPIMTSLSTYGSFLSGKKDFARTTKFGIASSIINVGSIFIVLFITQNPIWLVFAYFASTTASNLLFYIKTMVLYKPNNQLGPKTLSSGTHLSFLSFTSTVANYLDKVLIFHYLGATDVAVYSIAIAPTNQIKNIFKNLATLALPKLAEKNIHQVNTALYKRVFMLLGIGLAISLCYIMVAPFVYKLLFPKYAAAILFSQLFALILALRLPHIFIDSATKSQLHIIPKSWLYWGIPAQVIYIVSLGFLTYYFGITGAIISQIIFAINAIIVGLLRWHFLLKKCKNV